MSIAKNVINRIRLFFTPEMNNLPKGKTLPGKDKKGLRYQIRQQYRYRVAMEMETYRLALQSAENPMQPKRQDLYSIYLGVELDDQVISQKRIAKATVANAPFQLQRNGKPDQKLRKLFETPWFYNFLGECLNTEFWGHTLLEFNPIMKNGQFTDFVLVPREHVRPEYGDVTVYVNESQGIPFRENKEYPYLVELGDPYDLGLYKVAAIPVIRKKYSDTDWSLFSEKFGMPLLTIKTATRQENELAAKEEMARNFGANGWAILDDEDELNTIITNYTGTAHYVYRDRMDDADKRISKIINGQTGTSDEKAWVGSAEVHERLLNDFTLDRLRRFQNWINFTLIPFLANHGYPFQEDDQFQFTELLKDVDKPTTGDGPKAPKPDDEETDPQPGPTGGKKKALAYRSRNGMPPRRKA